MAFTYQNPLISHGSVRGISKKEIEEREEQIIPTNYSAIAFLPVVMIVFVVFAICGFYNYRRYKHDRQQINQLSAFYDIIEGTYYRHKTYDAQYSDGIRSLLVTSNGSSLFFQPTPHIKAINHHIPTCTLTILRHLSGTADCEEDETLVHMV